MKILRFRKMAFRAMLTLCVACLAISCGDDFTDDYNKVKKEVDEINKKKEEILKKNEELKGENLELIKSRQATLVSNYITGVLKSFNSVDHEICYSHFNTFEEGKLTQTTLILYNTDYTINGNKPTEASDKLVYKHSYNEEGVLIKSESKKQTITWGWDNQNCVSILITKGEEEYIYKLNKSGLYTEIEDNESKTVFTYDTNDNLISSKKTYKDKDLIYNTENKYNSENNLTSSITTRNGEPYREFTYSYTETGNTYSVVRHDDKGELYWDDTVVYDTDGNLVQRKGRITDNHYNLEAKYENGVLVYILQDDKTYRDGKQVLGTKKIFTEMVHLDTPFKIVSGLSSNPLDFNFKQCRFKKWSFSRYSQKYTLKDNYEIERFLEREKHHNYKRILHFDEDDNKIKEIFNNSYFEEAPFAPKSRTVKLFENNVEISTHDEVNDLNQKYIQYQNWVKSEN